MSNFKAHFSKQNNHLSSDALKTAWTCIGCCRSLCFHISSKLVTLHGGKQGTDCFLDKKQYFSPPAYATQSVCFGGIIFQFFVLLLQKVLLISLSKHPLSWIDQMLFSCCAVLSQSCLLSPIHNIDILHQPTALPSREEVFARGDKTASSCFRYPD